MTALWRAPAGLHVASARLPDEGELPSFDGATGWLNSPPLTAAGLRGKVVLVDFWTYTCINWLRQLPYVRAWAEKYSSHGLVVIGVHTPEFSFEHNADNVRRAVQDMRVTYPVAIDNDYAVWLAFGNHYWPALYFADARGRIRNHHFGEGEYGRSEMVIQQLLTEAGSTGAGTELVSVDARGLEAPAVDLHRHGGPLRDGPTGGRCACERAVGRRRRARRRGRLHLGRSVVLGRAGRAGAQEQPGESCGRQHAPGKRVSHPGAFGGGFGHRWTPIVRGLSAQVVASLPGARPPPRHSAGRFRRKGCRRRCPPRRRRRCTRPTSCRSSCRRRWPDRARSGRRRSPWRGG